jgi:hypothetical protein
MMGLNHDVSQPGLSLGFRVTGLDGEEGHGMVKPLELGGTEVSEGETLAQAEVLDDVGDDDLTGLGAVAQPCGQLH